MMPFTQGRCCFDTRHLVSKVGVSGFGSAPADEIAEQIPRAIAILDSPSKFSTKAILAQAD